MPLPARPLPVLGVDDIGNLLPQLSTVAQLVGLVGVVGLCTATWWVASRYYRTRTRLAERNARTYQKLAEKSAKAEQHALGELAEFQLALAKAHADVHA